MLPTKESVRTRSAVGEAYRKVEEVAVGQCENKRQEIPERRLISSREYTDFTSATYDGVRNLGVIFYSDFSFHEHVSNIMEIMLLPHACSPPNSASHTSIHC